MNLRYFSAAWDGKQVTIETKNGNGGDMIGIEIEGKRLKDIIYVSNQNGIAIVAI